MHGLILVLNLEESINLFGQRFDVNLKSSVDLVLSEIHLMVCYVKVPIMQGT